MPTTITTTRHGVSSHSGGHAILLGAVMKHNANNTWYQLSNSGNDDTYCIFASNQIRLGITTNEGLTAYGGCTVKVYMGYMV